jgi:hypothetical protein
MHQRMETPTHWICDAHNTFLYLRANRSTSNATVAHQRFNTLHQHITIHNINEIAVSNAQVLWHPSASHHVHPSPVIKEKKTKPNTCTVG